MATMNNCETGKPGTGEQEQGIVEQQEQNAQVANLCHEEQNEEERKRQQARGLVDLHREDMADVIQCRTPFLCWRQTGAGRWVATGMATKNYPDGRPCLITRHHSNLAVGDEYSLLMGTLKFRASPSLLAAAWRASMAEMDDIITALADEAEKNGEPFDDGSLLAECRSMAIHAPNAFKPGGHVVRRNDALLYRGGQLHRVLMPERDFRDSPLGEPFDLADGGDDQ